MGEKHLGLPQLITFNPFSPAIFKLFLFSSFRYCVAFKIWLKKPMLKITSSLMLKISQDLHIKSVKKLKSKIETLTPNLDPGEMTISTGFVVTVYDWIFNQIFRDPRQPFNTNASYHQTQNSSSTYSTKLKLDRTLGCTLVISTNHYCLPPQWIIRSHL